MIRPALIVGTLLALAPCAARAAEPDDVRTTQEKYQPNVDKGLRWLADRQEKAGHWEVPGGHFRVAMTAFAGLALMSEGSTTKEGRYSAHLVKAVAWMLAQAQPDGRL